MVIFQWKISNGEQLDMIGGALETAIRMCHFYWLRSPLQKIGPGQPPSTQQAREAQVDPSHSSRAPALGELLILSIAYFLPSCASSSAKSLQQDVQILCFPSSNFHFASIPLRTVWHHLAFPSL
jgi:hypothetical protein